MLYTLLPVYCSKYILCKFSHLPFHSGSCSYFTLFLKVVAGILNVQLSSAVRIAELIKKTKYRVFNDLNNISLIK